MATELRKRLRPTLAALLIVASLGGSSVAGPFEDADSAYGRGDYATALRLLRPLAEQGHAGAQYNLGIMYANGRGVTQGYAEAVTWYRKAADQGHAGAQNNLGIMYANGRGVPLGFAEAVTWYRKAADQGHAGAQNNLGVTYEDGLGVPQNYVQAYKWYSLGASRYSTVEKENRDKAIKNRDDVASKMTPVQVVEAQKLAREWKPTK